MPDRVTPPPLELATFVVDDVVLADATAWEDGRLHLDLGSFAGAVADAGAGIRADRGRPSGRPGAHRQRPRRGAPRRQGRRAGAHVPRSAGRPGARRPRPHQPDRWRGRAVRVRLARRRVHATGGVPDSFVDMAGPGAEITRWGSTTNVVVRCVPAPGAPLGDVDRAVRRASLRVARDIAATTIGGEPEPGRDDRTTARRRRSRSPAVCGDPAGRVGGAAHRHVPLRARGRRDRPHARWTRSNCSTARSRTARTTGRPCATSRRATRTRRWSGRSSPATASACGSPGSSSRSATSTRAFEKQRSAMLSARLAAGWAPTASSARRSRPGTPTPTRCSRCRACESLGIRTTAIISETNGGLTDHVAEADCDRERRQRGRARRPVDARPRDRRRPTPCAPASPSRRGRTSARACETGDMSLTAVPA